MGADADLARRPSSRAFRLGVPPASFSTVPLPLARLVLTRLIPFWLSAAQRSPLSLLTLGETATAKGAKGSPFAFATAGTGGLGLVVKAQRVARRGGGGIAAQVQKERTQPRQVSKVGLNKLQVPLDRSGTTMPP